MSMVSKNKNENDGDIFYKHIMSRYGAKHSPPGEQIVKQMFQTLVA